MRDLYTFLSRNINTNRLKAISLSILCILFSTQNIAQSYSDIVKREELINSNYREKVMNIIEQEVSNKQKIITKKTEKILLNLPLAEKLYDEGKVIINSGMFYDTNADGKRELNYIFEISYNCINPNGDSDDYPGGSYNYSESNSCRAICNLTQQFLDEDCKQYFPADKEVDIFITSTTDAKPISGLKYKGEFGDFKYTPVTFNTIPTRLSIFTNDPITNNAELAFLRAQSVKNFLQTSVNELKNTNNNYQLETMELDETGSQYRRSSIKIVVHNPFEERIEMMMENLKNTDTDIDINIPETNTNNNNTFVLIISNEHYEHSFPNVPYASNDSKVFQNYCIKTLGIPERQIRYLENASENTIQTEGVEWLKNLMKITNGASNILIYYVGHGIINADNLPYIIPSNVKSLTTSKWGKAQTEDREAIPLSKKELKKLLEESISLESFCKQFDNVPLQTLTIFCDAGFNGSQRNGEIFLQIPQTAEKTKGMRLRGNAIIFCAADFTKPVYSFEDKKHGFFTYYLLKTLRENLGNITYRQLFDDIKDAVSFESSLQGKQQIPTIVVGGKTKDNWENKTLK